MDIQQLTRTATTMALQIAANVAGALALWFIGRWVIAVVLRVLERMLKRQAVDETLSTYAVRSLSVILNVALIISVLGFFGVQTTTFAALIAAGGVAIGVAWSGLLANLAAGTFLVLLRPFKVGDSISAGGVTGTVEAVGLFSTTINSADNVLNIVGNGKIFADTIQNFSANAYRRVDLTVTIGSGADHRRAIDLLRERLRKLPFVLPTPAPEVDLLQLTAAGPVLCVRPYCLNEHYSKVSFEANRAIRETLAEGGVPLAGPPSAAMSAEGEALRVPVARR